MEETLKDAIKIKSTYYGLSKAIPYLLSQMDITISQRKIIDCIIHYTWGEWNPHSLETDRIKQKYEEKDITLDQFCNYTRINKKHLSRNLISLLNKKIINIKKYDGNKIYGINCKLFEWTFPKNTKINLNLMGINNFHSGDKITTSDDFIITGGDKVAKYDTPIFKDLRQIDLDAIWVGTNIEKKITITTGGDNEMKKGRGYWEKVVLKKKSTDNRYKKDFSGKNPLREIFPEKINQSKLDKISITPEDINNLKEIIIKRTDPKVLYLETELVYIMKLLIYDKLLADKLITLILNSKEKINFIPEIINFD